MAKLIASLEKHWRLAAIIAGGALIAVSALAAVYALGERKGSVAREPAAGQPAAAAPAAAKAKTYSDLYAVAIDNHPDARPQSGLNQAAIVFEAPVEGQISRYLAVFERGASVPEIGPVRSARPYFIDWAAAMGPALYLHVGGSPDALDRLSSDPQLSQIDRDGIAAAGFWRDGRRAAPHNVYVSSDNVEKMFVARGGAPRRVSPFLMAPEAAEAARGSGDSFTVPLSADQNFRPEWRYDKAKNSYTRFIKGLEQLDRSGAPLAAKDIVVMTTSGQVLDAVGRLSIKTDGSGEASVYHDGLKIDGTWKAGSGAFPRFYAADGSEIPLTDGNVWIEVVKK